MRLPVVAAPSSCIHRMAACSTCFYHRKGLLSDVQRESGLLERLNVALAECALLLRALGGRLDANHSG